VRRTNRMESGVSIDGTKLSAVTGRRAPSVTVRSADADSDRADRMRPISVAKSDSPDSATNAERCASFDDRYSTRTRSVEPDADADAEADADAAPFFASDNGPAAVADDLIPRRCPCAANDRGSKSQVKVSTAPNRRTDTIFRMTSGARHVLRTSPWQRSSDRAKRICLCSVRVPATFPLASNGIHHSGIPLTVS
jgi:hypothetical protein